MPATQTTTTINPTHTQASIVTALKNAFAAAGYPALYADSTSGTDRILVYQLVFDANKIYGTSYLRLKITTALAVTQQLFTAWNIAAVTGTNGGVESTATTFSANVPIEVRTFAKTTGEFRVIALSQGTPYGLFGYIRPETRHPSFDEDTAPFIFQSNNIWTANPFLTWQSSGLTPYSGTGNTAFTSSMGTATMSAANPVNNKRDILAGMVLFASTNQGVAAKSSEDLVSVAATGLSRFDSIQVVAGSEEYVLLFPGAGTMGVRII